MSTTPAPAARIPRKARDAEWAHQWFKGAEKRADAWRKQNDKRSKKS